MKRTITTLITLLFCIAVFADNGMWLPSQIQERIADMQSKGFKLTAQDIYNINSSSIKDAVVHFNGGCSGELISDNGLLITNYHCGYSQIQAHSSVDHDYLADGFWAMTIDEELPNKSCYVDFLVRMEDVTEKVLKGVTEDMTEDERVAQIEKNSEPLIRAASDEGVGYSAVVKPLYYGNQYFIWVYQTFTDVRLVGAPPTAIGKFGGDTDNWMWPRHTGDFSLFRIYTDKNGNPADYSPENIPFQPERKFKLSVKERIEGDFTFVYGYPGTTKEYVYSEEVRFISEISDPAKHNLRTLRLDVQEKYMSGDRAVRIQYASKNSSVSNAWKKWEGEMKGIRKMNTVQTKREFEEAFKVWAADKPEYAGLIDRFAELYSSYIPLASAKDYYSEAITANEIISFANTLRSAVSRGSTEKSIFNTIDDYFKNYFLPIDQESFKLIFAEYQRSVPDNFKPDYFFDKLKEYGSTDKWVDAIFAKSALTTEDGAKSIVMRALEAKDYAKVLDSDPAFEFANEFKKHYQSLIAAPLEELTAEINLLYRSYMKGQMEFDTARTFFPDANSTLRVSYGQIDGYSPKDAVYYKPFSTLDGVMQKDNPEIFDYNIPQKLRDIYAAKDFGRWELNGTVPICFIATNHTSGGNSGSPVIDAEGNLMGINFDRVWEGTMSDIVFDPDICRNISLDMRYVMFIIDKVAGCHRLLDEIEVIDF